MQIVESLSRNLHPKYLIKKEEERMNALRIGKLISTKTDTNKESKKQY